MKDRSLDKSLSLSKMEEKMFLFWRLVLAHLIADFPLQTDKVFVMKRAHSWGVVLHASVAGVLGLIFAGRYLTYPEVVVGLLLLWLTHIFIDKVKLVLNQRLGRERVDLFLLDQALHIGLIWLFVQLVNVQGRLPIRLAGISHLYNSDNFVKLLSGYIVATYGVMLLIYSIKSTLGLNAELPQFRQRLLEFLERGAIVTLVMVGGLFCLLIPVLLVPRMALFLRKEWSLWSLDMVLSVIFSLLVGVTLSQLVT